MKIDTEIRHVKKRGANLFLELGFAPDEAKRLRAASASSSEQRWRLKLSKLTLLRSSKCRH